LPRSLPFDGLVGVATIFSEQEHSRHSPLLREPKEFFYVPWNLTEAEKKFDPI
jgi:hypothetical protein